MQYYSVWPGAYSFQGEIKVLLESCKEYIENVLTNIEETEKKLA